MRSLNHILIHLNKETTLSIRANCTIKKMYTPSPIKCQELSTNIKAHPLCNEPDLLWKQVKETVKKEPIKLLPLNEPVYPNKVRFVCVSDTHSRLDRMQHPIPAGDVLIHAGDFTTIGAPDDVQKFSNDLKTLSELFSYQVVIAGNHELSFDPITRNKKKYSTVIDEDPRNLLSSCIYLEDSMIELFGVKIYGSPWQPEFYNWAFNLTRGDEILKKWNHIPDDTDILITHGPPLGYGDIVTSGHHVGCAELLSTIQQRVRPKYHIFGHIHEDHGVWSDGVTTFINASICNLKYQANNEAIAFDIELADGRSKESYLHRDEMKC